MRIKAEVRQPLWISFGVGVAFVERHRGDGAHGIFAARIAVGDLSAMRPISQPGSVRNCSHP
jgi:hypothetical protein